MKKILILLLAAWPLALALCLAACKTEPDLPADPHVPLVNPFVGLWEASGQYWKFSPNGTGGRAASEDGPFNNDFSFLYFNGKGTRTPRANPSLLILEDTNGAVSVTRYGYSSATADWATLTPATGGANVTLRRISGSPQVLNITNDLIGEWSAQWAIQSSGDGHENYTTWSLKYYADGTVKTYHHSVDDYGHQFENAYALRGGTLVIFGAMRFSEPVVADITQQGNGKRFVQETQSTYGLAKWYYTKVNAAEWL
jgi:hypothetical protein